ncbi:HAMP domain-containing sensor histidine kinase [Ktedonosporobacter rubrisoli]|uniref:HAMP domain-containing sensor histidine kinase n=1 Tax=Ktedonosporobacter rubrisoli TaxID=2509675 RepID=UPI0013EEDEA6|nr:sensor histidine kinase [Ktedonosporobacter rubrisoli]
MWTNLLLGITFLILTLVINWLSDWHPYPFIVNHMGAWFVSFLPIAAILFGASLLLFALLGGLFGLMTSYRLVRRLGKLARATVTVADGDYAMRVPVQFKDELGVLEAQFNLMAQRLAESQMHERELVAQNVRWEERTRLARELHDTISQNLFSLRLLAEGMKTIPLEPGVYREKLALVGRTAETITREMRALLLELRPMQLEDLGLKEALEELALMYHTRLDLAIVTDLTELSLSEQIEQALFQIAQEAISNAVRHAQASWISLKLTAEQEVVALYIQDDGKGVDPLTETTNYGLGLRSIQEQVRELNGSIRIQSDRLRGTCILVCLPYKEKNSL